MISTYNRTTKSAIDQKKSVIDDKRQGARLWLSKTCPVTHQGTKHPVMFSVCHCTVYYTKTYLPSLEFAHRMETLHFMGNASKFHSLQGIVRVLEIIGSLPPNRHCVQVNLQRNTSTVSVSLYVVQLLLCHAPNVCRTHLDFSKSLRTV